MTRSTPNVSPAAQRHRDAVDDTHDAYTAFKGWTLSCLWCHYEARGQTKAEALASMRDHYAPFGLDVH